MKVLCLAPVKEWVRYKVKIYKPTYVDIPFILVVQNYLVDISQQKERERILQLPLSSIIAEFRLKSDREKLSGTIFYEDLDGLAEFLVEEYLPGTEFLVDKLLKMSAKLTKKARKKLVLETLVRNQIGELHDLVSRTEHYWYPVDPRKTVAPVANLNSILSRLGAIMLNIPSGPALFSTAGYKSIIYFDEYPGEVIKSIPKRHFCIFMRHTSKYFYYNGEVLKYLYPGSFTKEYFLDVMSERELMKFEEKGRAVEVAREYLPPKEFRIEFLVRVPSKKEVNRIFKTKNAYLDLPANFDKPLLLYDTRSALKIDRVYPIVDSVNEAMAILGRAPNWAALPDDYASVVTASRYLEEKPYYIACGGINV